MTIGEYSVWEFYPDDTYSPVARWVTDAEAVRIAHRVTQKPAVLLGVIIKVIITDGGDFCVFQWEHGKGVTFPPPMAQPEETMQ